MALLELEKLRKDINILYGHIKCLMAKEEETSPLVATEWSPNHKNITGNPYIAGTYVFYNGHVYKCKFNNEGITPTNTQYWTDLGEGNPLAQEQSDFNSIGGRGFILNKPTKTSDFENDGEDGTSPFATLQDLEEQTPEETDPIFQAWLDSNPLDGFLTEEVDPVFQTWLDTNPLAEFLTEETDPIFQAWLATNPLSGFLTEELDPVFEAWLATNPLAEFITEELDPVFTAWLATSPLNDFVTKSTDQTITGNKTFEGDIITPSLEEVVDAEFVVVLDALGKLEKQALNTLPAGYTQTVKQTVRAAEVLTKGQAVYVSGANGTNILVSKASNTSEPTSSKTLGLIAQNLATNGNGFVITEGFLAGLDTSAATIGDAVWLGTSGNLLYGFSNKPHAPAHLVFIGFVTRVHANLGEIFVKVQNGFELDELHDVKITSKAEQQSIDYNSTLGVWENSWSFMQYITGFDLENKPLLENPTTWEADLYKRYKYTYSFGNRYRKITYNALLKPILDEIYLESSLTTLIKKRKL